MSANADKEVWKAKYIALLDKPTLEEAQLPEAQALKIHNAPSFLYRYRRFSENTNSELLNSYIWLSHPDDFNDPFDSALLISEEVLLKKSFKARPELLLERVWAFLTDDERRTVRSSEQPFNTAWDILRAKGMIAVPISSEEAFETFMKECRASDKEAGYIPFAALKNNIRIGCFSENSSSVLMWSHYAQNHTGICIEYDTQELFKQREMKLFLNPVIYKAKRFDLTHHLDPVGMRDPNVIGPILASCHKSPDWSYEKEWRLVVPVRPWDKDQKFRMDTKPSRILVGVKAGSARLEEIRALAAKISVPISVGEMSETTFAITFK